MSTVLILVTLWEHILLLPIVLLHVAIHLMLLHWLITREWSSIILLVERTLYKSLSLALMIFEVPTIDVLVGLMEIIGSIHRLVFGWFWHLVIAKATIVVHHALVRIAS